MPSSVGPNTFGEENLVFGYDLGDVVNSYKGEPTTNVIAGTNLVNVVAGTFTTNTTVGGVRILENTQVDNSHVMWNGATGFTATCSAGAYITVSAEYKTTCTIRMRFRDNPYDSQYDIDGGNIATISETSVDIPNTQGKWVKYSLTAQTTTANPDLWWYLVDYRSNNQFGRVEIRNWQIEVKSYATPYVNGTRSATQGLIDLTGNSTIDLTNVSFDSNAQMIFDGSNDTISVPSYSAIELVDNVSIEYVYKRLSTDPILDVIANKYHSTGWELFCQTGNTFALAGRNGDGTYYATSNAAYTIQNNQYYHLVAIKEGLSWRLYVNGELYAYLTANTVGTWSNTGILQLGGERNGYYPNMQLPVFKIYNRVLTASEVASNYKAIKGRFNI